jgi:hypothetical protein
MGKRDRERKARILAGLEPPHAVHRAGKHAEAPIRPMAAMGALMSDGLRDIKAATKEQAVRLVEGYVRSLDLVPKIERDEADSVTIGMYCHHGCADIAVTVAEFEENREWACVSQDFGFSDSCRCHAVAY